MYKNLWAIAVDGTSISVFFRLQHHFSLHISSKIPMVYPGDFSPLSGFQEPVIMEPKGTFPVPPPLHLIKGLLTIGLLTIGFP